ncbi:hypothetical protein ILUMI_02736 [Ignelater luminosus]|uniref:Uncharacterized protein n=1 Tax=Ignelater luminosus TaxID=2038154 RepID=A0A8K0GMW9_IGNLU|nr:hypothetical protein ILUMI_02736 [Ignelater luminosus]
MFYCSYETGNGIHVQETGQVKNLGDKKHETIVKQGSVTYHDEHGHPITLTYVADEHGFQAQGAHLPTPPPIPHEIQKALQQHHQQQHTNVIIGHQQSQQHVLQQGIGDEEYDQQQYEYV